MMATLSLSKSASSMWWVDIMTVRPARQGGEGTEHKQTLKLGKKKILQFVKHNWIGPN